MKKQNVSSFTRLLRLELSILKPFRKELLTLFSLTLLLYIADAVGSLIFSRIFNVIQSNNTDSTASYNIYVLLGISLAIVLSTIIVRAYQLHIEVRKTDVKISNYLNSKSMQKFFSFSIGQHINEHSGVRQSIVTNGIGSIQNQVNIFIYQFFTAFSQFVIGLCVLFYAHVYVGLLAVCSVIAFCCIMYYSNKKLVPGIRAIRERKLSNSRLVSELYRYVGLVKNEGQELQSLREVNEAQNKHQEIYESVWIGHSSRLALVRIISTLFRYGSIFLIVSLALQGKTNLGNLFLVLTWVGMFTQSLWQFMDIHKHYMLDSINIEKYFEILNTKPDIVIPKNPLILENVYGIIEFKNVTFSYGTRKKSYETNTDTACNEERKPILRNVSFVINQGEKVGFVGESGSGKTTAAALIRRSFDPEKGQILIDNNDVRLLCLKTLMKNIGSVEQEVALFDRSIKDNIFFGLDSQQKEEATKKLTELARIARLDSFFDKLEFGYDTLVGEKGIRLSGGERQRIGIARALAKDPAILIFDEATSALDSLSESIVQQSIDEASKGKTAIVIAHRLSTVKNCDKIFVFRDGIIVGTGTHEELLETCEYYQSLVKHQIH